MDMRSEEDVMAAMLGNAYRRRSHERKSSSVASDGHVSEGQPYILLNDQPVDTQEGDLLGVGDIAGGIAAILDASRSFSPFVLAIDAGWGMGKSTLLRQIESRLSMRPEIATLRFNAWTTEGDNALEGLIKSVLGELDPHTVRRWVRRLARQQRTILIVRIILGISARFLGVARLVDGLWARLAVDARSRNEMRDLINGMLSDWITRDGRRGPGRALAVFIDDLDRCSDDVIVKICEAVKLYLDVPGIIFVIACDQSVLARGVSASARGEADEGRVYLEKIVQVVYRVPLPEAAQVKRLISGYAKLSGTAALIDENVARILAEGTSRNPRKIKRIINSFVLEYQLDSAWNRPPLGSAQLVRAVLLQHIYSPFYEWLVSEDAGEDPIGFFLDYAEICKKMANPPSDPNDSWWEIVRRVFQGYRLAVRLPTEGLDIGIERLEGMLPKGFPELARSNAFVALLRGIGNTTKSRQSFRAQLIHRPLATSRLMESPGESRRYGRLSIFTLHDGREIEFDQLMEQVADEVLQNEPDTVAFIVSSVPKAPQQRIIYEIYRDRASYDTHMRQPYIKRFIEARRQCVLATNIIDLNLREVNDSYFPFPPPLLPE
jgi:quinol monooxygenase YgiN